MAMVEGMIEIDMTYKSPLVRNIRKFRSLPFPGLPSLNETIFSSCCLAPLFMRVCGNPDGFQPISQSTFSHFQPFSIAFS